MSLDDIVSAIGSPEGRAAIQGAIARDRAAETAFREQLVADCNWALEASGTSPDPSMLAQQRMFVELALPAADVHAVALRFATIAGRTLPGPPPSLTVEDV